MRNVIIWIRETTPKAWTKGIVHPIFKDQDKRDPLNYRAITLLCVANKLFSSVLNNRLTMFLEKENKLEDEQGSFRKQRGCSEQLFILTEVIHMRRIEKKKTYCCFIDAAEAPCQRKCSVES